MQITFDPTNPSERALVAVLLSPGNYGLQAGTNIDVVADKKPRKTTEKPAEEKKPEPPAVEAKADPVMKPVEAAKPAAPAAVPPPLFTADEVRTALVAFSNLPKHGGVPAGQAATKAVLVEISGQDKLSGLKPEHFSKVLEKVKALSA